MHMQQATALTNSRQQQRLLLQLCILQAVRALSREGKRIEAIVGRVRERVIPTLA